MSMDEELNSARLEREVEAQRQRVEARIGEIKEKLSPGQLLDEALAYTKDGGGAFAANLGTTIANNPLPATLLGVSLAWLIAGQNKPAPQPHAHSQHPHVREPEYPYARISSPHVRRVSHAADEQGEWWSEFEAGEGQRYKAKSNSMGHRLGHFADQSGKVFSGFIDDAGNRISQFTDESGNMIGEAAGWASHSWSNLAHGISSGVSQAADSVAHSAQDMGRMMQKQSDQLTRQLGTLFEQQPLIAGALAFAAGAALGAALPHTRQEDQLLGEAADDVRKQAGEMAAHAYDKGKEQVGEAYRDLSEKAGEVYDEVKDKLAEGSTAPQEPGISAYSRH